ncbi:MAG TPA: FkbM family methyltransferase [Pyrinomonadaceae bacterium]|jgi:FkbM family methyltransferase
MSAGEHRPSRRERLTAAAVSALQRAGLDGLAYSAPLRRLGKRFLLRDDARPRARQIASGLGRGLALRVLPETPKSYWLGTHEPHMQAALRASIRPGMTVYDCGANVGYFSVMFARLVGEGGRVYAFEPSPASAECLAAARELNGFRNLEVVPAAVWEKGGTLRFVRGGADASLVSDHVEGVFGDALDGGADAGSFVDVAAVSLDEFVYEGNHPPPDFIKLDVEGAEGRAVGGARRLLAERRPGLLLEIHGAPGREVWEVLREFDYTPTNIADGRVPETAEEFAVWIRQYLALPN